MFLIVSDQDLERLKAEIKEELELCWNSHAVEGASYDRCISTSELKPTSKHQSSSEMSDLDLTLMYVGSRSKSPQP